jgi:DNA-binding response OmpR family regulator
MSDGVTILIVEDEPDMLMALSIRLESIGFNVITAADGLEGLTKARQEYPDLILLDIMLPKMDGFKVCQMLKLDQKYKHIPIVLLSAKSSERDIQMGQQVGANAYLTKPFRTDELMRVIKQSLSGS